MELVTNFAGFVCHLTPSEQLSLHLQTFIIGAIALFLVDYFLVKRIKTKWLRILAYVTTAVFAIIGWHLLYLLAIDGNFLGCKTSPLLGF